MAKTKATKLTFDSIFEGNDLSAEVKEQLSALINETVERRVAEELEANEPVEQVQEQGDITTPEQLSAKLGDLIKNSLFRRLSTTDEKTMAELQMSMKRMLKDLEGNAAAEPAFDFLIDVLMAVVNDASIASKVMNAIKGVEPEAEQPEMEEAMEVEEVEAEDELDMEQVYENVASKVDKYLTYIAEQWTAENKVAMEDSMKVQIAENIIRSMKGVLIENNITEIPSRNLTEETEAKVATAEKKLNEQIEKNASLVQKFNELQKELILAESCKGLTMTQVDKLKNLMEGVAFESPEQYKDRVNVIKENAFSKAAPTATKLTETVNTTGEETSPLMETYVKTIKKNLKY